MQLSRDCYKQKFLNDEAFARGWIRHGQCSGPWQAGASDGITAERYKQRNY